MQNIDPNESNDILNKFENLQQHVTQPASSESSLIAHPDSEEIPAKTKTQSRFSSVIRKFSPSIRKKENPNDRVYPVSPKLITSSEAKARSETNSKADTDKKSKKKNKSAKTLFGLKKSNTIPDNWKVNAHEGEEIAEFLEPTFQDNENETDVAIERLTQPNSTSRIQITIKSKKISTVTTHKELNEGPLTVLMSLSSPSSTNNIAFTESTTGSSDKKKQPKTKIITETPQNPIVTTTATITQSKSKQQQHLKPKADQEQIKITQSCKDTPTKERARTKPSRLTTSPATTLTSDSRASTSIGAVRKTATTTRAAIKLVTGAKLKSKSISSKTSKGPIDPTENKRTRISTIAFKKESNLMINPQSGHRLPRPTATVPTTDIVKDSQTIATSETNIHETQDIDNITSPINSFCSNQNQHPTTPDCCLPQSIFETLSAPLPTTTTITNIQLQPLQETIAASPIDNLVQLKSFPQTDGHISLAESIKSGDYSDATTHYDSSESIKDSVTVHFAVSSSLGSLPQPLYKFSIEEPSVELSKNNKDSKFNREINHNHVQCISQPTLYDELTNMESNRFHYRYQPDVSNLSLHTGKHESTIERDNNIEHDNTIEDLTMGLYMEPTVMTSSTTEKREHLYKILVIGELGTGKTSFIKRYVHQFFSQNYRATIGVDFALKVLHWDPNTIVRLQLWDIAGQERFGNMTRVYYKEAVGAFIVFDVTRSGTFDCVSKWKEDLDSKVQLPDGSPIPCILLANKCDQDKQGVVTNSDKMEEYVKEHNFAGWFETSAKENINIDEAARALVNKILLNDKLISAADLADSEKFNLNNSGDQTALDGKNKCSC